MHRAATNLALSIALTVPLYFIIKKMPDDTFINTLYTTASIMFSIGMGVICTFNPDKIKNKRIYSSIKSKVIKLRNSFLWNFGIVTVGYVALQSVGIDTAITIKKIEIDLAIAFRLFYVTLLIISMCYFIYNFLSMQKLTFRIHESS